MHTNTCTQYTHMQHACTHMHTRSTHTYTLAHAVALTHYQLKTTTVKYKLYYYYRPHETLSERQWNA